MKKKQKKSKKKRKVLKKVKSYKFQRKGKNNYRQEVTGKLGLKLPQKLANHMVFLTLSRASLCENPSFFGQWPQRTD